MKVITKQFLNENAFASYPLDANATYEPYSIEEASRINSLLLDLKISVPKQIANSVFIANIKVTNALVSMVLMGTKEALYYESQVPPTPEFTSTDYTAFNAVVLATVTATVSAARTEIPIALNAELPGVGGWVIFGPGVENECNWSFSGPASSTISSLALTRYDYGGVFSVAKKDFVETLDGDINIIGQNGIEVVTAQNNVLSIRFSGTSFDVKNNLNVYAGACGNRPESNTCTFTPIQTINNLAPAIDANAPNPVNEIVLVLDQPLYATLVDVNTANDNAGFAIGADTPIENFCENRLLLPPVDCLADQQPVADSSPKVPSLPPKLEIALEVQYLDSLNSVICELEQQHPNRPTVSVFKPTRPATLLGEAIGELHVDVTTGQWQVYSDAGPSLKLFGAANYNLTGSKDVVINGLTMKVSLGPLNVFDKQNQTKLKLTVDSADAPDWGGIYKRTYNGHYVHTENAKYYIKTFAFTNNWALYVNKTLTAGGELNANGFSTQLQNYTDDTGTAQFRTIALTGIE